MFHLILYNFILQNEENKKLFDYYLHSISGIFLSFFPIILTSILQKPLPIQVLKKIETKMPTSLLIKAIWRLWLHIRQIYHMVTGSPRQPQACPCAGLTRTFSIMYFVLPDSTVLFLYFCGQDSKCNLWGSPINSTLLPCQDLEKIRMKQKDGQQSSEC